MASIYRKKLRHGEALYVSYKDIDGKWHDKNTHKGTITEARQLAAAGIARVAQGLPFFRQPWEAAQPQIIGVGRASTRGCVYFVQGSQTGLIKIGFARNPTRRLKELQTGNGEELRIICVIAGVKADEGKMHARFAAHRVRPNSEWFRPHPDLVAFISESRATPI